MLFYSKQSISEEDIRAVINILKGDCITQGPKLVEFESAISQKVNAKYSIAVNSATSALHLSCLALGLKSGDFLWTSPISFVASSNCGIYCGAKVDFVDIDPNTGLMSINALKEKLCEAKKSNTLPKILIPVHLAGTSCEMEDIKNLSKIYGFKVIEDASHAIGGRYKNDYVGSCKYSDITVFSFHPVKIITTGEGGMALTNSNSLAEKIRLLRGHGISRDDFQLQSPGPWYYEQQSLGFNYRITEFQAALGISQLKRLEDFVLKRNELMSYYRSKLKDDNEFTLLDEPKDVYSSYHLAILKIRNSNKELHKKLFIWMRNNNVWVQLHYWPIHLHPYYGELGFKKGDYPNSENYGTSSFSIPLHMDINYSDQDLVINLLKKGIKQIKMDNK